MPAANGWAAIRQVFGCGCIGCLGLFFIVAVSLLLVTAIPDRVALSLAAAAAILPVPIFVFLILRLDRYEREPWQVLLASFLWGAFVAVFFAAIFNELIGGAVTGVVGETLGELVTASVVAPVVEETAKGFALLILFFILRHEFDDVLDGIVYGALVGIGFAMTENVLYFGRIYLEGGLAGLGVLFYLRVVLGGFGHSLYTGTTGAALGFARTTSSRLARPIVPVVGYGLAVLQHATWNFSASLILPAIASDEMDPLFLLFVVMPVYSVFLTGPGLVTLLLITAFAWRRESQVIRAELADEVERGTITPAEYAALPSQRARFRRELVALRRLGLGGWRAQRNFHQAATELAFRKWHLSRGERPKRSIRRTPEDEYRLHIAAWRARLGQEPTAPRS